MACRLGLLLFLLLAAAPARAAGLDDAVTFTEPGPLAAPSELARRSLSPLSALRLHDRIAAMPPIALGQEHFVLYVPPTAPPTGYGLLVFISPAARARLPSQWAPVLDRQGMIFVSPDAAGNDTLTFERREPLALAAAWNLLQRYPIDRSRLYVGGFSGGSRVALKLALAYPDLFRGALLDAGSDPIGEDMPPPPAELFRRFQETSRLVYLTGARDEFHMAMDLRSQQSMQDWCVFDWASETLPWTGHDLADAAGLNRGLQALARHVPADPARLSQCRAGLDAAMDAAFVRIDDWTTLIAADRRYGGLAAERSLALAQRLARAP